MSLQTYFRDKHVIVTGGSSGIGLCLAHQLVALGAEVSLVARREGPLKAAQEAVLAGKSGAKVHVVALDVSDFEDVQAKMGAHIEAHPAQMLINNAGIALPGRFLEQDYSEFRSQMDINFFGCVHMCKVLAPHFISQGQGHICNVGSLAGVLSIYGYSSYAATKFAMYGFSDALRAELKPHGIAVTHLLPPDTDTPQHEAEMALLPEETKAIAGNVKMLTPDQVAQAGLQGMAAGRFEVIPGFEARSTIAAARLLPGVTRWVCDNAVKKISGAKARAGGS